MYKTDLGREKFQIFCGICLMGLLYTKTEEISIGRA